MKTADLHLVEEWDKVFPRNERVDHSKVTFVNRYGITLAADLYKPKNAEAFESWYESLLSNSTTNTSLTVGQAQKIINMSFKYLFCCADIRNSKLSHFTWCHMPLDSVTLEWLGMKGLVWNSINDSELYSMITNFARNKAHNSNLLLKDFEVWKPKE